MVTRTSGIGNSKRHNRYPWSFAKGGGGKGTAQNNKIQSSKKEAQVSTENGNGISRFNMSMAYINFPWESKFSGESSSCNGKHVAEFWWSWNANNYVDE